MDAIRTIVARLAQRLPSSRRNRLLAAGLAALCIVLLAISLLIITAGPSSQATTGNTTVFASATAPATSSATLALPSATRTPTKKTTVSVVTAPPPPPIPTPPPNPTNNFCPTPTPLPAPTATDTPPVPTATATATATATPTGTTSGTSSTGGLSTTSSTSSMIGNCQQCPYYKGNNPSQSQIRSALYSAADLYHLPRNLLLADAWQESRWHEDVISCDGGIGLMQVQYYTYPWLNGQSVPECGLSATNYDPNTLQGNADLGAKFLAWISCFYSYWGDNGGTAGSPGVDTIAWYYQQAGLQYPDTLNANGSPNPKSFCAAVFNDLANPEYAALPSTTSATWSCPYSATTGDPTLLDITLSAYNEGPGYTDQNGIQNWWYVQGVEDFIPQFAAGTLPA